MWVKFPLPLPLSVSDSSAHGSQYPTICATLEGGYVNGGNVHGDYENMIGKDPPKKPGPGDDDDIDTIHELMMTILVVLTTHGALKTTRSSSTYDTIYIYLIALVMIGSNINLSQTDLFIMRKHCQSHNGPKALSSLTHSTT